MSRSLIPVVLALLQGVAGAAAQEPLGNKEVPPHQVIALYFHRTERCPTCRRIAALAEDAVAKGFAEELKSRVVEFRPIDFQDERNAALSKAYRVEGPTLVLANVFDGEVKRWTPMPRVWQLVGKPKDFAAYVQAGVTRYLRQTRQEAESEE